MGPLAADFQRQDPLPTEFLGGESLSFLSLMIRDNSIT
jgi:hypothetical protein